MNISGHKQKFKNPVFKFFLNDVLSLSWKFQVKIPKNVEQVPIWVEKSYRRFSEKMVKNWKNLPKYQNFARYVQITLVLLKYYSYELAYQIWGHLDHHSLSYEGLNVNFNQI